MEVRGRQTSSADRPVAARKLVDANPGIRAHVRALYLENGSGDLLDQLFFLIRRKDVFDNIYGHE